MDNNILWGVLAGFLAGSFGYILINFFWGPTSGYKKLRKKIDEDLNTLLVSGRKDTLNKRDFLILERFFAYAKEIDSCFEKKLPTWYKLSLERKGEKPREAIPELLNLAAIKNPAHLEKRILKIRGLLFPGESR